MSEVLQDHRQVCDLFTEVTQEVDGRWAWPSPCSEWDARAVVEHVIGFHDVLILRPLGAKPTRPKNDPIERWTLTVDAMFNALLRPGVLDEKGSLIVVLTTDVLVHTWDLSKATGTSVTLDPRLCQIGLDRALANREQFEGSDMFGSSVHVPQEASVQDRLLGFFGRDPHWTPPS